MDIKGLTDEILAGKRLKRGEDLSFFKDCDLAELRSGADRIRAAYSGDKVDLCSIISGRGGKCGENCKFCAQSAHNHTNCDVFDFKDEDEIVAMARSNQEEGVDRFAIVDSGYGPSDADFEKIIKVVERMHKELKIELCWQESPASTITSRHRGDFSHISARLIPSMIKSRISSAHRPRDLQSAPVESSEWARTGTTE